MSGEKGGIGRFSLMSAGRARHAVALAAGIAALLLTAPCPAADRPEPDPAAAQAYEALRVHMRSLDIVQVAVTGTVEVTQDGVVSAPAALRPGRFTRLKEGGGEVRLGDLTSFIGAASPRGAQRSRTLSVTHAGNGEAYLSLESTAGPYWILLDVLRDLSYPMLGFLFGEEKSEDSWMQLHWKSPWLAPTALSGEVVDEQRLTVIRLTSDDGDLDLFVDRERMRPVRVHHTLKGGQFVEAGATVRTVYLYEYPVLTAEAAREFAVFAPGERQRVETMAALIPRQPRPAPGPAEGGEGPGLGDAAPVLALELLGGDRFDLSLQRGRVVVVDFWATWCAPCLAALPQLERLQRWANAEQLAVDVITVNTFELPGGGAEARRSSVRAWLRDRPLSLPVALDLDDQAAAAWGVTGIPATFVIDPGGRIVARHAGMSPEYLTRLQSEVERALELGAE